MNLATLERMTREGDLSLDGLRYLLNCRGEAEWLDYKQSLSFANTRDVCEFARDAIAMRNMGGGYIVLGVQDKTWDPIGLTGPLPYDAKQLRDGIRKVSGLEVDVYCTSHELHVNGSNRRFGIILIRASAKRGKRRVPSVVMKDYHVKEDYGLRKGDIYVRDGDSTQRIQRQDELLDLLDALESRTDEDALSKAGHSSPFSVTDGLYRLLERGYTTFIGRDDLRQQVLQSVTQDPRIWIVNVHGPGGVGKSALVNWAVYELYENRDFEAILHLSAKDRVLTETGIWECSRSLCSFEDLLDHLLVAFEESTDYDLDEKKQLAMDYLEAYKTLLVLDNMETVHDGRIVEFLRQLPPSSKSKALLTSRSRTDGWELPVSVKEFDLDETQEFINLVAAELSVNFPMSPRNCRRVYETTGGLPLAIKWMIGRYKLDPGIKKATRAVQSKDSPVLRFSFENIWNSLSGNAKTTLGVLTIFDTPPTHQDICIASEIGYEIVESALSELASVTLVDRVTNQSDGKVVYVALPITLQFARNAVSEMGDLEIRWRQRFQAFQDQMELRSSEVREFETLFARHDLTTPNEKRAAILCNRAQSEMFRGNTDNADSLFKQARDLSPNSAYVHAMSASYELARNRIGNAKGMITDACKLAGKKTGALCYTVKARILFVQKDKDGRCEALRKALGYDPENVVLQHQYGVALSMAGQPEKAIEQFDRIVDSERERSIPRDSLMLALKTRIINHSRLGRPEAIAEDLAYARSLMDEYPHLENHRKDFAEFDDLLGNYEEPNVSQVGS